MIRCKICGNKNRDGAKTCSNCGAPLPEVIPWGQQAKNIENSNEQSSKKIDKNIIIGVVAVLVILIAIIFFAVKSCAPKDAQPAITATESAETEPPTERPTEKATEKTAEKPTEKPTEAPTEQPTEQPTEKPTEKPTEPAIYNPTSTGGWGAQGNGDYVAQGLHVDGYAVLTINHYGDSNFAVTSYQNGDDYDDLLVNVVGNYSGTVLIEHSGTFDLEIQADGEWSIQTSGLLIDDTTTFSGHGDYVTGITTHDGGNWEITNDGDENFAVIEYGVESGYMDLLVNTIGNYLGVVKAEKSDYDNVFFEIMSNGNWTMTKK